MTIPTDIPIKQITYNGTVVPIDTGGSVLDRTVTFKYNNEDYEIYSVNAGGSIPAPTTPAIPTGQVFSGWKTSASGGSVVSFPYTPASDEVTLYGSASEPAYLTFSSPNAFSMSVESPGWIWPGQQGVIEVSSNHETWSTWSGSSIQAVQQGQFYYLYFRGTGNTKVAGGGTNKWNISGSSVMCIGNIETLLDYSTVQNGGHPNMIGHCYGSMFIDCSALISAPLLPATALVTHCYDSMFMNCTSLIMAPALPATELIGTYCYYQMFCGCSILTAAPELPATILTKFCYSNMFKNCNSLVEAPNLPATSLEEQCYSYMFQNCNTITAAPVISATIFALSCCYMMFSGCTALATVPDLLAATLATNCCAGMFYDCTALTTAPALPATILASTCYMSMFHNCTALTTAPALPATNLPQMCYAYMFDRCSSLVVQPYSASGHDKPWTIPASGAAQGYTSQDYMFYGTTGQYHGDSSVDLNTTFYTQNTPV